MFSHFRSEMVEVAARACQCQCLAGAYNSGTVILFNHNTAAAWTIWNPLRVGDFKKRRTVNLHLQSTRPQIAKRECVSVTLFPMHSFSIFFSPSSVPLAGGARRACVNQSVAVAEGEYGLVIHTVLLVTPRVTPLPLDWKKEG